MLGTKNHGGSPCLHNQQTIYKRKKIGLLRFDWSSAHKMTGDILYWKSIREATEVCIEEVHRNKAIKTTRTTKNNNERTTK